MHFHTAIKFHSFISIPHSTWRLFFPSLIASLTGSMVEEKAPASLTLVSILWGKMGNFKASPRKELSNLLAYEGSVSAMNNYFAFYANVRFVDYSISICNDFFF